MPLGIRSNWIGDDLSRSFCPPILLLNPIERHRLIMKAERRGFEIYIYKTKPVKDCGSRQGAEAEWE